MNKEAGRSRKHGSGVGKRGRSPPNSKTPMKDLKVSWHQTKVPYLGRHGSLAWLASKKRPEFSSQGSPNLVGAQKVHRCQPVLHAGTQPLSGESTESPLSRSFSHCSPGPRVHKEGLAKFESHVNKNTLLHVMFEHTYGVIVSHCFSEIWI